MSSSYGVGVYIAAIYFEVKLTFGAIIVIERFEEFGVEVGPFLEGESPAIDAGVDISGDQSSLDQESTRTAHRVGEVALPFPAALEDYAGSESLIDGGFGSLIAISALGEGLATGV